MDPYKVLDVQRDASQDDVKRAYRRLALRWHPDRNPDNQAAAEQEFKRISNAYKLLSDPAQRAVYDRGGFDGARQGFGAQAQPFSEQEAAELFRQMFGNKPLHEIIREVEQAAEEKNEQMAAQENQLRDQADRLRREIADLELQARRPGVSVFQASQVTLLAQQKSLRLQQVEQALQQTWTQRLVQRSNANFALSRLRMLDPVRQAESRLRVRLAWGTALGAYFICGTSLVGAICVFLGTSLGARLAFAAWARLRR